MTSQLEAAYCEVMIILPMEGLILNIALHGTNYYFNSKSGHGDSQAPAWLALVLEIQVWLPLMVFWKNGESTVWAIFSATNHIFSLLLNTLCKLHLSAYKKWGKIRFNVVIKAKQKFAKHYNFQKIKLHLQEPKMWGYPPTFKWVFWPCEMNNLLYHKAFFLKVLGRQKMY